VTTRVTARVVGEIMVVEVDDPTVTRTVAMTVIMEITVVSTVVMEITVTMTVTATSTALVVVTTLTLLLGSFESDPRCVEIRSSLLS
jgi:hypothetical protein